MNFIQRSPAEDAFFDFFSPGVLNATVCISIKNRYIYFEVPKAGSTSIKSALHDHEVKGLAVRPDVPAHAPAIASPFVKPYQLRRGDLVALLKDPDFFKFSFVRDPYARMLSAYQDKLFHQDPATRAHFRKGLRLPADGDVSFAAAVERICSMAPRLMDKHFCPQVYQSFSAFCVLDFVGRLENFAGDMQTVAKRVGLNFGDARTVAPHATNAAAKLDENYTPEIRALVAETYAADFATFNYRI